MPQNNRLKSIEKSIDRFTKFVASLHDCDIKRMNVDEIASMRKIVVNCVQMTCAFAEIAHDDLDIPLDKFCDEIVSQPDFKPKTHLISSLIDVLNNF